MSTSRNYCLNVPRVVWSLLQILNTLRASLIYTQQNLPSGLQESNAPHSNATVRFLHSPRWRVLNVLPNPMYEKHDFGNMFVNANHMSMSSRNRAVMGRWRSDSFVQVLSILKRRARARRPSTGVVRPVSSVQHRLRKGPCTMSQRSMFPGKGK